MAKDLEMLPNTRQVRDFYCHARQATTQRWGDHSFEAEFDAWLAANDAEVAAKALSDASREWRTHVNASKASYVCPENWLRARAAEYLKAVRP